MAYRAEESAEDKMNPIDIEESRGVAGGAGTAFVTAFWSFEGAITGATKKPPYEDDTELLEPK
jgi:hypothetical protein